MDDPPTPATGESYLRGLERLLAVVQELSLARTLDDISVIVRSAARELAGADGATFVLREGEYCHYVDEDSIMPLWKGRRFPIDQCVSGWAMKHGVPVVIEDITDDARVPSEAYRPTFVKSLVMVPIRTLSPVGAIGTYWAQRRLASPEHVRLLCALADSTSIALENVGLYARLEDRVRQRTAALTASEAELAAKNTTLLRVQRQKEEMSALLVHDLKSPASGILMSSRARLRSSSLPDTERRSWKNVAAAAETIHRLALNLLDVSRSEDGAFAPKLASVDLRRLLGDVADLMGPLVDGREQTLQLCVDAASDTVRADGELLSRVLQNLVDNAVRHNAPGGHVHLEVRARADGGTEIRVVDEGSGVPAALRRRIFDKYVRLGEDAISDDLAGRGLGLAFCRLAVESHGGDIAV
jgi:signal transduction histidine kinase